MAEDSSREFTWSCPPLFRDSDRILLAHGGGGRLMQQLLEKVFLPAFANEALERRHDGAVLEVGGVRLAFTTDSYVVRPLVFPGGDIGSLAVHGTANDLAMCGARPLFLSAGFILEEGLPVATLERVVGSMREAALAAEVALVTGDTKVVDKGKGDGIYINTAGIGLIEAPGLIGPEAVRPADAVILSGDLGAHGIAVLSVREGLEFDAPVESDTAPLWAPVQALIQAGIELHCLRDLTRGGLSAALNEIATAARLAIRIEEAKVPVCEAVRGACELLGLDPLYVACEGRFAAFVPGEQAERAVEVLRRFPVCAAAEVAGWVEEAPAGTVILRSRIGANRVLDLLSGEQLPRIC
jgi:hydrogenase expression/formation protein HypE